MTAHPQRWQLRFNLGLVADIINLWPRTTGVVLGLLTVAYALRAQEQRALSDLETVLAGASGLLSFLFSRSSRF